MESRESRRDPFAATNYLPTQVGIRVVFGTEKPRLTINEVYAEAVNNPTDPGLALPTGPTMPPHVRVWAEFQNATQHSLRWRHD